MKLHKRTFRSVPNPMFVQKSQEAVEGGSSNLVINELPLSQEEVSTLLQSRPVVLEATDPRIELFNTSDILTVTLFEDKYSAFVMKNPDSATARFLTFQVFTSVFVLALLEDEGTYALQFLMDEFPSSERISSIEGQIVDLNNEIGDCIKYAEIDDELSATSTNPVQNKIIYEALQGGGGGGSSLYEHRITIDSQMSESDEESHVSFTILNSSSTTISTFAQIKSYLPDDSAMYGLVANGLIRSTDYTNKGLLLVIEVQGASSEGVITLRATDLNPENLDTVTPVFVEITEADSTIYDNVKQIL